MSLLCSVSLPPAPPPAAVLSQAGRTWPGGDGAWLKAREVQGSWSEEDLPGT